MVRRLPSDSKAEGKLNDKMTAYNLYDIEQEIINFLRSTLTDPNSRSDTTTDTFSGDAAETDFTLSQTAFALDTVTIGGAAQKYNTDYTLSSDGTKIVFTNAPASGSSNISVGLTYTETWVYPDFAKPSIQLDDFPRVAVSVISSSTDFNATSGDSYKTSFIVSITVVAKTRKQISDVINDAREQLTSSRRAFGSFTYIHPNSESAIADSNIHQKLMQRTADYFIPYKQETI